MYIPRQQLLEPAQVAPGILQPIPDCNASAATYPGLPPEFQPPSNPSADIGTIAVFIQVTWALWLVFILLMLCRGLFASCIPDTDDSDSGSDVTDSAWLAEDSTLPESVVASKHRKRLKKLEQMAPSQTLQHWRRGKSEEHVQTFATVSRTLSCAICLESLEDTDQIRELRCGHLYHADCLSQWVEKGHHDCPLCKYDILGLKKTMSKAQLSVSRSATRTNLNATTAAAAVVAVPERGEASEDVLIQIDSGSDGNDFTDGDSDGD